MSIRHRRALHTNLVDLIKGSMKKKGIRNVQIREDTQALSIKTVFLGPLFILRHLIA
jgi:hypothetical protein